MVRDWPDTAAVWRVLTTTQSGRRLSVVGWHAFATDVPVGGMSLHVSQRSALLITGYWLADSLVSGDRADALGALVACAAEIAVQLDAELKVGTGCLEWQLDSGRVIAIQRAFPGFKPVRRTRQPRRGKRYLRMEL